MAKAEGGGPAHPWRVALLTMADRAEYVIDDQVAVTELQARGLVVAEVPWTAEVDWGAWDLVIVRTTWDYQHQPERFLAVLAAVEAAGGKRGRGAGQLGGLANPLEVIRWNIHKSYLRALDAAGVPTVPTEWGRGLNTDGLDALCGPGGVAAMGGVLKPTVGAGAGDTFRIGPGLGAAERAAIVGRFREREWMAQPFVQAVVDEGEYSLFWFAAAGASPDGGGAGPAGGPPLSLRYSHAIRKRPKPGDFRVQEEWGGVIVPVEANGALRAIGEQALDVVVGRFGPGAVLQARVDLVRLADGRFAVIELELVEPSLYFRTSPVAAARFADGVEAWLAHLPPSPGT